jgi:3-oxoacyl-[acyl-carrier protein] reductase
MVNYGLKDKVALITGANNPQGIGATTAFAFAREGAKVVLIYKRIHRQFDQSKTDKNGVDRYFEANSGNANRVMEGQVPLSHLYWVFLLHPNKEQTAGTGR